MSDKEEDVGAEQDDKVEEPKAAPAAKKAKKVPSRSVRLHISRAGAS